MKAVAHLVAQGIVYEQESRTPQTDCTVNIYMGCISLPAQNSLILQQRFVNELHQ